MMTAMVCEMRRCRGRGASGSSCHFVRRRPRACNRRPRDRPALRDGVGRYYDPATGQFLSVDPLVQQTQQGYRCVGDDPVNAIDPRGNIGEPGNPCRLPCARPGKRDPSRTRQHRSQTIDCECANSIGHFLQHSSES
jgi:hypothetical protein